MIAPIARYCTIDRYTPVWALGTGLKVALAPGDYQVTGKDRVNGTLYYRLANAYRIDSREILQRAEGTSRLVRQAVMCRI